MGSARVEHENQPSGHVRRIKLLRRATVFCAGFLAAQAVVWLLLFSGPATYTATATLMLEPREACADGVVDNLCSAGRDAAFRSEMQAISSAAMARKAAEEMQPPARDPGALLRQLHVSRLGRSALIEISFTDAIPERASAGVNAFAAVYLQSLEEGRALAQQRGAEWLARRAQELRADIESKERAVARFRARIGLAVHLPQNIDMTEDSELALLYHMEREAEMSRQVYDGFLTRVREIETDPYAGADARIIGWARAPNAPDQPHELLLGAVALGVGALGGLMALMGAGLARPIRRLRAERRRAAPALRAAH
jgi:uncharacterized protein involved in exopolysaccharide biosynthesis